MLSIVLIGLTGILFVIHTQYQQRLRTFEAKVEFTAIELSVSRFPFSEDQLGDTSSPVHSTLQTLGTLDDQFQVIVLYRMDENGEFVPDNAFPSAHAGDTLGFNWTGDVQAVLRHVVTNRQVISAAGTENLWEKLLPLHARVHVFAPIHSGKPDVPPSVLGVDYAFSGWSDFQPGIIVLIGSFSIAAVLVLLLGNMILLHTARQSTSAVTAHSYRAAYHMVVIGLLLTTVVAMVADNKEADSRQRAFIQLGLDKLTALSKTFHSLQNVEMEALVRFFAASEYVTASEYTDYTDYLMNNPAVRAWLWIPRVTPEQRPTFERRMREEGFQDFQIWYPQEDRSADPSADPDSLHYPLTRITSRDEYSEFLGFDSYRDPLFSEAISRAAASGRAVCTDPVEHEFFSGYVLAFKAVRQGGTDRSEAGFVACVLDLQELLLSARPNQTISLALSSGFPADQQSIQVVSETMDLEEHQKYTETWPVFAFGRTFRVTTSAGPGLYEIHPIRAAGFVLLAGTLLTLTLTILTRLILRRRLRLEQLVAERTRELETTRHRAEMAVEAADLGIWDWNLAANRVSLNESWAQKLGFTLNQGQVRSSDWRAMIPDSIRKDVEQTLEKYLRGESEFYQTELPLQSASGDTFWVISRGRVIERDDNGQPLRINGTYLDITERKNAEEALANREMHLRALLNTIPDLVWVKDAEGRYLSCNRKFERLSGLADKEIHGKTDYDIFDREQADAFRKRDLAVVEARKPLKNEEQLTYADDGHIELLETIKAPLFDVEGNLVGVLGVARDITERKQAEAERENLQQQLMQAAKMDAIGSLAGGIAHDLNNLLVPIIGSGEFLAESERLDVEERELVKDLLSASFKARDLIRQLLAFSRKQALVVKQVDINQIVMDIHDLLRRTIPEDIRLNVYLAEPIKPIDADMNQIEQILMNLIVNAVDAIPEKGSVAIETSLARLDEDYVAQHADVNPGEYVLLSVSDTGAGMDEETRLRVFEPFYSTKGEKGTGLGLATVFGIVKQHGGTIWVYSEPGNGTTFKVYLPVSKSEQPEEVTIATSETVSGSESILVVEDNEEVRKLVASMLIRFGYTTITAKDGFDALDKIKSVNYEVSMLLTDIVMPKMNGRELYEQISEVVPNLRVLYMSGYTDEVITHRGLLERGLQFIQKPFTMSDLAAKVRATLDQS
ncbi:PAS domain S-box protein [bacterium]|nr:PAS domain S-box protein [bacterium]